MDTVFQAIPQPRSKRRYRSAEERRRIVEETLVPGTSVAIVARAHGVNANQVFGWRKLYHAGRLGSVNAAAIGEASTSCVRLLPVTVSAEVEPGQQQTALRRLFLRVGISLTTAWAARIHLRFFDPLYLKQGKLENILSPE